MWWLWPHLKRVWAAAGTASAGLMFNYFLALWTNQSAPDLQRLSRLLLGYWYWTGGGLTLFAIVSVFAARAHRRHEAPHFIGTARGRRAHKGSEPPPLPASTALSTLMVGRQGELAQLREMFTSVLQGKRRVVFVAGEAGIGKTTFVRAFLASLERDGEVRIAGGQCVEQYGTGEPYMPMLEALTELGRRGEYPHLLAILHRLAPAWLAQLPALLTAAERVRIHGETQGLTQQRMLREMAETLAAIAADAPLVLLLEDLHWSDASTLDLIAAIARRTEPARLLVVGTYRPVEMLAGDHPLRALKQELELHGHCHELRLKLLDEQQVATYLAARFADNGARFSNLAPAIHQRSDGNPLFMVNVVDYLAAQGTTLDPTTIEAPRNIRQMIERNIERLTADEQRVLESASVAGAEFSAAAVAAAIEQPVSTVEACLTHLSRHEQFVAVGGMSEWPDLTRTTGYRFLHALYQEVLYERTPVGHRDALHSRIASREEAAWGERTAEIAAELAYHYGRCGNKSKALKFLELAGERAITQRAYREAERHYDDALAALQALPESAERDTRELTLLMALGRVMEATRGLSTADTAAIFARARGLAERGGGAESLQVFKGLWGTALMRGEARPALALADQMLVIAGSMDNPQAFAIAHYAQGQTRYMLADLTGARQHLLRSIEHYREEDFSGTTNDVGVPTLLYASLNERYLGYPDRALRYEEEARSLARRLNKPYALATAAAIGAGVHGLRGDFKRTLETGEEAVRLSTTSGFQHYEAIGKIQVAWARAHMGESDSAVEQIREALEELNPQKVHVARARYLTMLCEIQALVGAVDDALVTVEQALQTNPDVLVYRPDLFRVRGALRFRQDSESKAQVQLAVQDFCEAIDLARGMGAKSLELRATMSLARVLGEQGDRDKARTMLAAIYSWFTEGFDTADLKEAKALLDELSV